MTFKNVKQGQPLWEKLRLSGSMPGEMNGDAGKKRASEIGAGGQKKKKGGDGKSVDMDKLAEGLQKLGEDDLLQVVQMVHDNKSEDSWMRNDVERKWALFGAYGRDECTDTVQQRENFTSTSTPYQTTSSRCSGYSQRRKPLSTSVRRKPQSRVSVLSFFLSVCHCIHLQQSADLLQQHDGTWQLAERPHLMFGLKSSFIGSHPSDDLSEILPHQNFPFFLFQTVIPAA